MKINPASNNKRLWKPPQVVNAPPCELAGMDGPVPFAYPPRIPLSGTVSLDRPQWARLPEDMGDLLQPASLMTVPTHALETIRRYLVDKPDVLRVDIVGDEQGQPRRIGELGSNPLFLCRFENGDRGVFKSMEPIDRSWVTRMKEESAREIIASHVLCDLGVHSITYRSAVAHVGSEEHEGVASEFVEHRTLLHDPTQVHRISEPEAAIRGSILDAWMGNFDRIVNGGNVWVQPDGRVIFGDYGCTFRKGLTACGVPKVNRQLFIQHATADNVEPVVAEIRRFSDREILKMVERAGAFAPTLSLAQRRHIVDVLRANRDELRKTNPFAVYYNARVPAGSALSMETGLALGRSADDRFGHDNAVPDVVAWRVASHVRGYEPLQGRDIQAVRETMANLIRCQRGGHDSCALVQGEHFIAWQQVCKLLLTPEKSLELGLGLQ